MSETQQKLLLPPRWADDALSDFIQAAFKNALATFVHKKQAFNVLLELEETFKRVAENLDNSNNFIAPALFHRSHASFLSSCRLSMSGQVTETFPQLRSCLEHALYALHMNDNYCLSKIWLQRHKNEESFKEVIKNFRHVKVMKTLHDHDTVLHDSISTLYQQSIDFGGHPNERAMSSSTVKRQEGDTTVMRSYLLQSGDSPALDYSLRATAQTGLGSLMIFQLIYKQRFSDVGVEKMIESLKLKV